MNSISGGVPYLLGDDDEVNQRSSWVPMQQSQLRGISSYQNTHQQKVQTLNDIDGVQVNIVKRMRVLNELNL